MSYLKCFIFEIINLVGYFKVSKFEKTQQFPLSSFVNESPCNLHISFVLFQDGNFNLPWFITIGTGTALLLPCLIMLHARRLQTFTGLLVMALWAAGLLITITSVLIW